LNFTSSRTDELLPSDGLEQLNFEVNPFILSVAPYLTLKLQAIRLLDFALVTSDSYLPSPNALHELIVNLLFVSCSFLIFVLQYKLIRSSSVLRKQAALLNTQNVARPPASIQSNGTQDARNALDHLLVVTDFYAEKIEEKGGGVETVQNVMKMIADEIEANGMHEVTGIRVVPPM
jgi:hypothetical protein